MYFIENQEKCQSIMIERQIIFSSNSIHVTAISAWYFNLNRNIIACLFFPKKKIQMARLSNIKLILPSLCSILLKIMLSLLWLMFHFNLSLWNPFGACMCL